MGKKNELGATIGAYQKIADEIAQIKPETVILISPHSIMYRDYFHISPGVRAYGDMGGFGAPQVSREVVYDQELAREIERLAPWKAFRQAPKESVIPGLIMARWCRCTLSARNGRIICWFVSAYQDFL